jgi:hypothetical protein
MMSHALGFDPSAVTKENRSVMVHAVDLGFTHPDRTR